MEAKNVRPIKRPMGIFKGEEEILAFADDYYTHACWVANSILKRVGDGAFYLCIVLEILWKIKLIQKHMAEKKS